MFKLHTTLSILLATTAIASAQSMPMHRGTDVTLSYATGPGNGGGVDFDIDNSAIEVRTDWAFGAFGVQGGLSYTDSDYHADGGGGWAESQRTDFSLFPYYQFSPNAKVALIAARSTWAEYDESMTELGIAGMFRVMPGLTAQVAAARGTITDVSDLDINTLEASLRYNFTPELSGQIGVLRSTFDYGGGSSDKHNSFTAKVSYALSSSASVFASFENTSGDWNDYDEMRQIGIGLTIGFGGASDDLPKFERNPSMRNAIWP